MTGQKDRHLDIMITYALRSAAVKIEMFALLEDGQLVNPFHSRGHRELWKMSFGIPSYMKIYTKSYVFVRRVFFHLTLTP